jgi:hypothetical protein
VLVLFGSVVGFFPSLIESTLAKIIVSFVVLSKKKCLDRFRIMT